jgi:hypothetical protein
LYSHEARNIRYGAGAKTEPPPLDNSAIVVIVCARELALRFVGQPGVGDAVLFGTSEELKHPGFWRSIKRYGPSG